MIPFRGGAGKRDTASVQTQQLHSLRQIPTSARHPIHQQRQQPLTEHLLSTKSCNLVTQKALQTFHAVAHLVLTTAHKTDIVVKPILQAGKLKLREREVICVRRPNQKVGGRGCPPRTSRSLDPERLAAAAATLQGHGLCGTRHSAVVSIRSSCLTSGPATNYLCDLGT